LIFSENVGGLGSESHHSSVVRYLNGAGIAYLEESLATTDGQFCCCRHHVLAFQLELAKEIFRPSSAGLRQVFGNASFSVYLLILLSVESQPIILPFESFEN
jgi:hypothetical protein